MVSQGQQMTDIEILQVLIAAKDSNQVVRSHIKAANYETETRITAAQLVGAALLPDNPNKEARRKAAARWWKRVTKGTRLVSLERSSTGQLMLLNKHLNKWV